MEAERELETFKQLVRPGGAVYLFYQPPADTQIGSIAEKTVRNLTEAGFVVQPNRMGGQKPVPLVCIIGVRNE